MSYYPSQDILDRALEIGRAISALTPEEADDHENIVRLFDRRGDFNVFVFMDDSPGDFIFAELRDEGTAYGVWHSRLRRVRNNRESRLFDQLKEAG